MQISRVSSLIRRCRGSNAPATRAGNYTESFAKRKPALDVSEMHLTTLNCQARSPISVPPSPIWRRDRSRISSVPARNSNGSRVLLSPLPSPLSEGTGRPKCRFRNHGLERVSPVLSFSRGEEKKCISRRPFSGEACFLFFGCVKR